MEVLLDTKKQYIEHLLDIFSIPIAKRIYKIFNDTSMNIKLFQQELINIKGWNNNKVKEEYNELIKKTKCKYLDKLLEKIIIIDIKLKIEGKFKLDKNNIDIIKSYDFIHKCLINVSIFCWKNVYLFSTKNLKSAEKQYHLNLIEKNIRKIIKNTIRDIIPFEKILDMYDNNNKSNTIPIEPKIDIDNYQGEEEEDDDEEDDDEEDDDEEEEDDEEDDEEEEEDDEEDDSEYEEEDDEEDEEQPKEQSKEQLKELPEELPKELPKELTKELPKELPKEITQEEEKTEVLEEIKIELNEEKEEQPIELSVKPPQEIPQEQKQEIKELLEEEEEETDDDFIDASNFKGINKKKPELLSSDDDESSSSDSEVDTKPIDENIKRINLSEVKRARYYS